MTTHLKLLCHASTAATHGASFSVDEPLDSRGLQKLVAARRHLRHMDLCLASPAQRAVQTAEGLGLDATVDPALRDCDYGRWSGHSVAQVQEREPQALAEWLRDPANAPHGGESILALTERATAWLDRQKGSRGVTVAITHPSFIRAAIVSAIEAEPRSFWRIDVAPLSLARLSGNQGRWTLVSLGVFGTDSMSE